MLSLVRAVSAGVWFVTALFPTSGGQQNVRAYDSEIRVEQSVETTYPAEAVKAGVQGTVVVAADLRDDGRVAAARAIAGPRLLVDAARTSVVGWTISSGSVRHAIIVLDFQLVRNCREGVLPSPAFELRHHNMAVVVACAPSSGR